MEVENLIENYPKVVKKFLKAEKKKAKEDSFKKLTIAINKQIQDDVLDMAFVVQKLREKLESTDGYQAAQK